MNDGRLMELVQAALISAAVFIALWLVKRVVGHFAGDQDDRRFSHALAARLVARTRLPLLLIAGVFAGSFAIDLPDTADRVAHAIAIGALLLQAGLWGNELVVFVANRYQQRAVEREEAVAPGTVYALRFLTILALWTVLLLVALDNVGIEITALVAGLGIGGIAVALAAQSVLGDLFAGLAIVLDRPFAVGDFIIVGDLMGTVEHVGVKTTRIRSLGGEELIFANNDLVSARVRNYRRMVERRIVFTLGLVYGTSVEQMRRATEIVREAIERQELARFDRVHFISYGDFSLNIEAVYYVLNPDYIVYMDTQQAINFEILERFEQEGLEFAFPTRTLHVYDETVAPVSPAR